MLLNCGVGEDSWESLVQQGDPTSFSLRKSVLNILGRTNADAEAPILWPLDVKSRLIGKDFNAGKDWRQEKGTTEDETAGWHHQLNGHEFEQTLRVGEGQGSLACCNPWSCRVSYNLATEQRQHMEKQPVCCQRMELFHSAQTNAPMKSGFWWQSLIS